MDDPPRRFPIHPAARARVPEAPWSVPFWAVEPHNAQARVNHRQALWQLAERGGLDWSELAAVLEDRPWQFMEQREAWKLCESIIRERDNR